MKTLLLIIAVFIGINLAAQSDTTYTVLKPNLVLVEIVADSVTANDFLFKKKEINNELQRINNTIVSMRLRKEFLLTIKAKME
jgi:hypothetical protein